MRIDEVSRIYSEASGILRNNEKGNYHTLLDELDTCCKSFNCFKNEIERLNDINWNKIPIDTLVETREKDDKEWLSRYFAGIDTSGNPIIFYSGCTSKTASGAYIPVKIRLVKEG